MERFSFKCEHAMWVAELIKEDWPIEQFQVTSNCDINLKCVARKCGTVYLRLSLTDMMRSYLAAIGRKNRHQEKLIERNRVL